MVRVRRSTPRRMECGRRGRRRVGVGGDNGPGMLLSLQEPSAFGDGLKSTLNVVQWCCSSCGSRTVR